MFTPDVAIKATPLLNGHVEEAFKAILNDLLAQMTAKVKHNSSDLELRAFAIKKGLIEDLINYRKYLEDAIKHGRNS